MSDDIPKRRLVEYVKGDVISLHYEVVEGKLERLNVTDVNLVGLGQFTIASKNIGRQIGADDRYFIELPVEPEDGVKTL